MRVIAGTAKKRILAVPKGLVVRPTADRVKEALFNILGASVFASSLLDLFAGAGTVGIEALSRGADKVVFVEKEINNIRIIRKNLQITGLADRARCLCMFVDNALERLASEQFSFDLIFMDPPYTQSYVSDTLSKIAGKNLLRTDGLVVAENDRNTPLPENVTGGLCMCRQERYSGTMLTFYQYK